MPLPLPLPLPLLFPVLTAGLHCGDQILRELGEGSTLFPVLTAGLHCGTEQTLHEVYDYDSSRS